MSTLYEVNVREIANDTTVFLHVRVVHPDAMYISPTPGFALMQLWESTDGDAPLATEVDLETAVDAGWMRTYARGFVREVELVDVQNEPPQAARDDYQHAYWQTPDAWLEGTLRIEVTDAAWISHLSAGQSWESTAFEPNSTFDACDPIRFEPKPLAPAAAADARAGLMPIPRLLFLDHLKPLEEEIIWFPRYSEKAYVVDEVYEGDAITEELLDSLVGEVVWYSSYGDQIGVLMPGRMLVRISHGSRGSSSVPPGQGKIGRARFNTEKKRLAEPLTISGLARTAMPAIVNAEVDGATVSLTVYCFETGRELLLQHEAAALALIANFECHPFHAFAKATSKLGILLHSVAQKHGIRFGNDIVRKAARGIIVDATMRKTKDAEPVDFDALSNEELIAKLRENPWDTWTVDITVTDPAWIEHLPSVVPFSYGFYHVDEPEPWNDEPLNPEESKL